MLILLQGKLHGAKRSGEKARDESRGTREGIMAKMIGKRKKRGMRAVGQREGVNGEGR